MTQITINENKTYQKIEGFGASGAWWSAEVGDYDNIDNIMDLLYDPQNGIGLNTYRYNIGAGYPTKATDEWRVSETIEIKTGLYDLLRDKSAINVFKAAVERGAINNVLFINSPPARMSISGYVSGAIDGNSNLSPEYEDEFADYCIDITKLFLSLGYPIKYISPINEPQWTWGKDNYSQEGCHYDPEQIIRLAKKIIKKINKENLSVKLSLIESGKWNDEKYTYDLYKKFIEDKQILHHIDHFACHSYWTDEIEKRETAKIFNKILPKLPLHQTEWCQMEWRKDLGINGALLLAKTLHDDLTILSVSSWSHWLAVSKYDYNDGLIYVNTETQAIEISKRMWALGNYSKFIKQGYVRVDTITDTNKLLISAYKFNDGNTQKLIVVAVNTSDQDEEIYLDNLKYNKTEVYVTNETANCNEIFDEVFNIKSYIIFKKSIVTFLNS